jgi:hypothetical protein
MARAGKSARIAQAISAIQRGDYTDYSKAAAHYRCDRTTLSNPNSLKEEEGVFGT